MDRKKILFIVGSLNQTTMMHKISKYYEKDFDCCFSTYYGDGIIRYAAERGVLDFSILGGEFRRRSEDYLNAHDLEIDYRGANYNYDLVFLCSDLIVPKNIRNTKIILVQEGMTDPENFIYYLVKYLKLPRWIASTSTTGLSNRFDKFCVASEGYKEFFIKKGVKPQKLVVTGIPNFDNVAIHLNNEFPHKNFVLVATSDSRETFKYENRKAFIRKCLKTANGRQIIFKLHPNENFERATKEIKDIAPEALVYTDGNIDDMIANCETLITKYSSVVYVGITLGKEVYSYFDLEKLKAKAPIQNGGTSAETIAKVGYDLLFQTKTVRQTRSQRYKLQEALNA
ncbi:MAG: hypothetical protein K9J12_04220 [Melioribacteraceae bacterium]|nr:hypothetical protein [Melioribacteraceae bacterium]MCF8263285.1 hypothetical protein [Melioribacteraceae bacterium]MCF8412973.1 hypothetical protein [Melioribacteraceae bacterium]MCF8432417.1 hypothetical protein [Melioribacteraceae bacterium]